MDALEVADWADWLVVINAEISINVTKTLLQDCYEMQIDSLLEGSFGGVFVKPRVQSMCNVMAEYNRK